MTTATIIMHQGINTGAVFGHVFDFTGMPVGLRVIFALVMCILLCTFFTAIGGFFTAKFKMHPFISTMSNMLVIFGLVTYATKGVSFGAIEPSIPKMIIPRLNGFPTIILWAVAAIVIVWFIWNKTTFGKNLYAVGGNPEAASVSGISVFAVTMGAFILAGILYGFGSWLECARMVGSGSAAYGQGWEMDAIAACVVGGVSFTGGIGKISGVVVGEMCIRDRSLIKEMFPDIHGIQDMEGIRQKLQEGQRVWFIGSGLIREDILKEWAKEGILSVETADSCLLERYWFNIYRLELGGMTGTAERTISRVKD